jgi:hypothetical protein
MKKLHGWGDLNPQLLEEFENSDYYSGTKINDEYVEEFHKYMTDIQFGNHMDDEDDIHESFHLNESSYPTLDQVENADHEQICSWYRHLPSPGDGIDFDSDNYKEEIEKQVEIMKVICDKYKNGGGFNSTLSKKNWMVMKYLRIFEEFNLFKRNEQSNKLDWKGKFDQFYKTYQEQKQGKSKNIKLTVDIKNDGFNLFELDFKKKYKDNINLFFNKRENKYDVADMSEVDMDNMKSDKGHYTISKEEYESYLKKIQEIDNWLNDEDDKLFNKSTSSIGDDGKIDLNVDEYDLAIDDINYKLKKELFKKYIGKSFEFEAGYSLWTSKHENKYVCERYMFPIVDIEFHVRSSTSFYFNIITKDPYGDKAVIWFEHDTKATEYVDLSNNPKDTYHTTLEMDTVGKELSRRQKQELEKNPKFPHAYSYKLSPSKYDSIEFMKELRDVLVLIMDSTKNQ